jgi:adenylosuccinate lyase
MLNHSMKDVILPALRTLEGNLTKMAEELADVPMLCRTHGQSATPSTMGKEIANFAYRLRH